MGSDDNPIPVLPDKADRRLVMLPVPLKSRRPRALKVEVDRQIKALLGNLVPLDDAGSSTYFDTIAPGLRNLLYTFPFPSSTVPSSAFCDRVEMSWNPFNQHLLLRKLPLPDKSFPGDFERLVTLVTNIALMAHEGMHVLLWEPFFAGHLRIRSHRQFEKLSLSFEGLCFWYADLVITPAIRCRLPDGNFTFRDHVISSPHFHPDRAFRAIGLKSQARVLELYLHSFSGYKVEELLNTADPFVRNLRHNFYDFYRQFRRPTLRLYETLKRAGIFDEYHDRFCAVKGSPSLLDAQIHASLHGDSYPFEYCKKVVRPGLHHIGELKRKHLSEVLQRRAIQIRAYHVFMMRQLFESARVFSSTRTRISHSQYVSLLEKSLGRLELALFQLCRGEIIGSTDAVQKFDRAYQRQIRRKLQQDNLYVSDFEQIYPAGIEQGLWLRSQVPSVAEMEEVSAAILKVLACRPGTPSLTPANWETLARLQALASKAARSSNKVAIGRRWRTIYNQLLKRPALASRWSLPLDIQSPRDGVLRELSFTYV